MKFKVGFAVGCAAGYWVASKAGQLHRLGVTARPTGQGPRVVDSRADAISAEKMRALSELARARLSDLLETPIGGAARERVTGLIGASLSSANRPLTGVSRGYR